MVLGKGMALGECRVHVMMSGGMEIVVSINRKYFYLALENNRKQDVLSALEDGLDPNYLPTDSEFGFWSPLHIATQKGNCELMTLLLKYGADINQTTLYQYTPLYRAVYNNNLQATELLIKRNPDYSKAEIDCRDSIFHTAAKKADLAIFNMLVINCSQINDIKKFNSFNRDVLDVAIQKKRKEKISFIDY